jgi:hypothetical protein
LRGEPKAENYQPWTFGCRAHPAGNIEYDKRPARVALKTPRDY